MSVFPPHSQPATAAGNAVSAHAAPPREKPESVPADARALLLRAHGLLVFQGLLHAAPLRELVALLSALVVPSERGAHEAVRAYGAYFRALAEAPTYAVAGGTPLAAALAAAVLLDENALSRRAEEAATGGRPAASPDAPPALPAALVAAAAADLRALQALAAAGPHLAAAVATAAALPEPPPQWTPQDEGSRRPVAAATAHGQEMAKVLVARVLGAEDWGACVPALVQHYAAHGSGLFARYRAFRWHGEGADALSAASSDAPTSALEGHAEVRGRLLPLPVPDAVRASELIGYQEERALLRRNTVHFLAGFPANNVLLYGDRGTGKSSSIKALLNEGTAPAPEGEAGQERKTGKDAHEPHVRWDLLRIVEVPKARLGDFPAIVALLRGRPQRFILFVDDLSFEEGETQYKDMKAMLEGGLEARPANVVVYATSNRRHLIREQFADRAAPDSEEVHARDTVQEKLSFSDRFGLTITFPTPDQAAYLAIAEGLARQRGLPIAPTALRARAIEWAAWHNGRSGRTAKQFVDYLEGELGVSAAGSPQAG